MLYNLVTWVIVGVIAGYIVSLIQRRDFKREWVNFTLLGMSGSAIGGFLFRLIGGAGASRLSVYSILVSVIGAFAFLWLVNAIRDRQR